MRVAEMMNPNTRTCRASDTAETAVRSMSEQDCGSLPVVDEGGRVIGMITDRDVCLAAYAQGKTLRDLLVGSAMSKSVVWVHDFDNLTTAEERMQEARVRRLPVLDSEHNLVGILSLSDLAREAYRRRIASRSELGIPEITATLALICEPRSKPTTERTGA